MPLHYISYAYNVAHNNARDPETGLKLPSVVRLKRSREKRRQLRAVDDEWDPTALATHAMDPEFASLIDPEPEEPSKYHASREARFLVGLGFSPNEDPSKRMNRWASIWTGWSLDLQWHHKGDVIDNYFTYG